MSSKINNALEKERVIDVVNRKHYREITGK